MIEVTLHSVVKRNKTTQKELIKKMNYTSSNLSRLNCGKTKQISFEVLDELCRELNCQPGDILRYIPDKND